MRVGGSPIHRTLTAMAGAALLLVATGAQAWAQQPPPPPPVLDSVRAIACGAGCDVVSGIVFDSLVGEPLVGAIVTAMPSGESMATDADGRFVFLSAQRIEQLVAYHHVLDETGLGALVLRRPSAAAKWDKAELTTPSLLTLWPILCGEKRPIAGRSVIITGTARLSDTQTRVAGARIMVQWPKPKYSVGGGEFRTADAITDSLGNYLICGVESFVDPSLLATSNEAQSGVVMVASDRLPIRRIDLVLGRAGAAGVALRGRVVNEKGELLPGMRVSLDGAAKEIVTDAEGVFTFAGVPPGSRMLSVRAIGYSPVAQWVDVVDGQNAPHTVQITKPFMLEGVTVTSKTSIRLDRQEFEMRKRAGWGRIVDSMEISRAPNMRVALAMVPGVRVEVSGYGLGGDFDVVGSSGCSAAVFVDGVLDWMRLAWFIPPDMIAAIEVYRSSASAPGRFIMVRKDNCPVVLVWTKFGLRP